MGFVVLGLIGEVREFFNVGLAYQLILAILAMVISFVILVILFNSVLI